METKNLAVAKIVPVPVAARSKTKVAAAQLLRLWVRIPPESWMSVCCECWVLSSISLCDELITRPEKSYRVWCVWVWSTSWMRRPWPTGDCCAKRRRKKKRRLYWLKFYSFALYEMYQVRQKDYLYHGWPICGPQGKCLRPSVTWIV